nr:hypothetical protein [Tanacetum cinerariifolium]
QSPRPPPPQAAEGSSLLVQQVLDKCSTLILRVEGLETANTAQQLEILKLKARVLYHLHLLTNYPDHLHHKLQKTANTAQQLEILKLKARVKKLERLNKVVAASTLIPAAKPAVVDVSTSSTSTILS